MSDLQLALLVLGVLIIIGVVLFNWWQERNIRVEAESRFQTPNHDILMDDLQLRSSSTAANEELPSNTQAVDYSEQAVARNVAAKRSDPVSARRKASGAFNTAAETAPVSYAERVEPTFGDDWLDEVQSDTADQEVTAASAAEVEDFREEALAATPAAEVQPVQPTAQPQEEQEEQVTLPEGINQQIDLIALLYLSQPASGMALREFLLSLADIDKPIYAYGLDQNGHWQPLTREQEHTQFVRAVCNIQLADRSGPISKTTLNRFQLAVDQMGAELSAQIEWLGSADPLRYASELDQFCMEVDKMVSFHLMQGESGPFTGTKFRGLAEAGGLVLHEDGNFYYAPDHGQPEFSLVNQDQMPFSLEMLRSSVIRGVTFQLDIPRVKGCLEAFNHMVLTARQMENSLNAKLIDDNQRPLGDTQIEKIRQQLKMIHAKMVTRGIVPGSDNALRLFS